MADRDRNQGTNRLIRPPLDKDKGNNHRNHIARSPQSVHRNASFAVPCGSYDIGKASGKGYIE